VCVQHATSPPAPDVPALSRRGVLRAATAGAVAVGAAGLLAQPAQAAPPAQAAGGHGHGGTRGVPVDQISIQLYTLRDQLAIDLDGTLAALADIGYRKVEHAGFVGRSAAEFRAALDAAGLRASSGHVGIPQPFDADAWQRALADARTVGSRYVVHPFFGVNDDGPIRDSATYRAFARDLNRAGLLAKRAGLKFGYHNHHFEFFRLDGGDRTGFDVLTAETDPDLVHLEVDLFWVTRGARDPVDVIRANRGRIRQFHVKDMNADGSFEDPGQGLIDFARIFGHSREAGVAEYIVERDNAGTAPRAPADALSTARVGFDYLRSVRF
jgi:sugar phosphate isomerase/epimerase